MKKIEALGLDLGNGYVKIVCDKKNHVEPAVFAYAPFTNFLATDNEEIEINGERILLGTEAIESGIPVFHAVGLTDSVARYEGKEYEYLLFGFIAQFFKKDVEIENLVLGLPNSHFTESSKILKDKFQNEECTVKVGGETHTIKINNVTVLPQPFGVYVRDNYLGKNVIVVDLGEGTNDYSHINKKGNILSMFTVDDGLKKYYLDVLRYLQSKHPSLQLELAEMPRYLSENGIRNTDGTIIPVIDAQVTQMKDKYSRLILQPIIQEYDHMNQFDTIIVTGGGAEAFKDSLEELKETLPNIEVVETPQLANAEGFYKYALQQKTDK